MRVALFALLLLVLSEGACAAIFSSDQHDAFQQDGFIVVSGLIDDDLMGDLARASQALVEESPKTPFFFSVSHQGAMFGSVSSNYTRNVAGSVARCEREDLKTQAFRQVALFSQLPKAAAELMQLDDSQNMRILRDIFLARHVNDTKPCGWHVDDQGFWPESFISTATETSGKDQNGINAWVAIDDFPAIYQGSMIVSPGSHNAAWRHSAYLAIGQNRSEDGGKTKEQVVKAILENVERKYRTCELDYFDPDLHNRLEGTARVLDIKRGDVVFATRNLFHKTAAVTDQGIEHYLSVGQEYLNRYSIRYVPGTARLPNGWSVEWSIVADETNTGQTLDDIAAKKGKLFYPQVWPDLEENLESGVDQVATVLPDLKARATAEFQKTIFG